MRTRDELIRAALKTHDSIELFKIIQEFGDLVSFMEAQKGFKDLRLTNLLAQVERQKAMIENLEKTLWGRK